MHAIEFVESYFDAWNHRDAKAVADHLAVDGLYCDIPQNVERSHDELIISLGYFFSTNRHQYELIGDILQSVNTIAFQYRIDDAKGLLSGFNGQGNAVLNIAFSVGFNSKSAFYSAFKKRVGMTPAQYRRAAA